MLRITTTDTGEKITLKLEGKLSGPWVEEFERCWQRSADIYERRGLVVDLSGVTFVDSAGKKLLCSISSGGAQLVGSGLVPRSLIDEICTEEPASQPGKTSQKPKQAIAHLLLLILLPLFGASSTRADDSLVLRLTLHDAVAAALKENPQVQIATLHYAESREDTSVARSALLPQAGLDVFDQAMRENLYAAFGRPSSFPSCGYGESVARTFHHYSGLQ